MLGLPFHNGYRRGRSRTPIWYHQPGSSVAVGQAKTLQHPPELAVLAEDLAQHGEELLPEPACSWSWLHFPFPFKSFLSFSR